MRKYLDRSRQIPLQGRPIVPDWFALLHMGQRTVSDGRAATTPYLETVMWERISEQAHQLKPATFDPDMVAQWVAVDEKRACDTLREQWGMARAPESADEALAFISTPDCITAELGSHRLTAAQAMWDYDDGEWAVGHCRDCTQPLLWFFPPDGSVTTWPFYEYKQESPAPPINPSTSRPSEEPRWTELNDATTATLAAVVDETLLRLKDAASTPTWTIPGQCDPGTEELNEESKLDRNAAEQKVLRSVRELLSNHRLGYNTTDPEAGFEEHSVPVATECLRVSLGREETHWFDVDDDY